MYISVCIINLPTTLALGVAQLPVAAMHICLYVYVYMYIYIDIHKSITRENKLTDDTSFTSRPLQRSSVGATGNAPKRSFCK